MFSPVSRRSPSSHSSHSSNLGSQIRSRVNEGVSGTRGGSGTTGQPSALSEQAAGSTAAAQHERIRQAIMSRFSDGFDAPGTTTPNPTSVTPPRGTSQINGTPSPTDPTGTTDTSGVPKSGDPQLDQWDPIIAQEAEKWGVPPENLKALIALESGGDPNAVQINPTYGNTYGLAQINQSIWGETAAQRGYDLNTPEGQIGFAASLLRDYYDQTGSWDQAHSMYFNPSGTGDSVNGTSNAQYIAKIHEFIDSWK